ncbi:MAG: ornithine cyclodeaminase family protein, partial [Candidatus Neomarinimicrobiota bacterium]
PVGELIFDDPPGDVHIKYGYIKNDDIYVIKIASGFFNNAALGLPSSQGMMLAYSQKTGAPVAILHDEAHLTNIRTAAAGAVVAKYLAPDNVDCIGIIGTGTQARLQLEYLSGIVDCKHVKVWGRHVDHTNTYCAEMNKQGYSVSSTDLESLTKACNFIVTTTPSTEPLIASDWVQPGTHITAMGSDTQGKQELDTEILNRADRVVADSIAQCIERGEIAKALEAGVLVEDEVVELGHVISGKAEGRTRADQLTVADLTGVAVQDIQITKAVFNSLK